MKLFIQIPCFNEEDSIKKTIESLPQKLDRITEIQILIINDGSTDSTMEILKKIQGIRILNLPIRKGLSNAFSVGKNYCIENGADIIVNTDADNQYNANNIKDLVKPIIMDESDIVIGARKFHKIKNFSKSKIFLQNLGSKVISLISGNKIIDATSGFRAFSRDAAISLNIFNNFTYTHETIIQASYNNLRIKSIPVETNIVERPSRLFKSNIEYIFKSAVVILRVFMIYKPFQFFLILALPFFVTGLFLEIQWVLAWFSDKSLGLIPRLFLGGLLLTFSIILIIAGIFADLISTNRKMLEDLKKKINQ